MQQCLIGIAWEQALIGGTYHAHGNNDTMSTSCHHYSFLCTHATASAISKMDSILNPICQKTTTTKILSKNQNSILIYNFVLGYECSLLTNKLLWAECRGGSFCQHAKGKKRESPSRRELVMKFTNIYDQRIQLGGLLKVLIWDSNIIKELH